MEELVFFTEELISLFFHLKECFEKIFGSHYPVELVSFIIIKLYPRVKISCGLVNTKILINKRIYATGSNYKGFLGLYKAEMRFIVRFYELHPENIKKISSGHIHTLAVTTDGNLYVWGSHQDGQLGLNNNKTTHVKKPKILDFINIKKVSCGSYYSIILDTENKIYACGSNDHGQLGIGKKYAGTKKIIYNFRYIKLLNVKKIACGNDHTMALTIRGEFYVWGHNNYGQLGLGNTENRYEPTQLILPDIIKIKCGHTHSIVLTNSRNIYTWGCNNHAQLGLGDFKQRNTPHKVGLSDIISISCGHSFTIVLNKYGDIYGWGKNKNGRLGLGKKSPKICELPTKISLSKIVNFSCGYNYTIAIDIHQNVYGWGENDCGQLGVGNLEPRYRPCEIEITDD